MPIYVVNIQDTTLMWVYGRIRSTITSQWCRHWAVYLRLLSPADLMKPIIVQGITVVHLMTLYHSIQTTINTT